LWAAGFASRGCLFPHTLPMGCFQAIDLELVHVVWRRRTAEPAFTGAEPALAARTAGEAAPARAEAGRRLLLLVGYGRGDKYLVAPHDRARPAVARHLDLPGDVLVLGPLGREALVVAGGRPVRPAELRPVAASRGGREGHQETGDDYGSDSHDRFLAG